MVWHGFDEISVFSPGGATGDRVCLLERGDLGEQYVVRYRLEGGDR